MKNEALSAIAIDKVEAWHHANQHVQKAREELARLEKLQIAAEADLAKWMLPDDIKDSESVSLWFGDTLLRATAYRNLITDPLKFSICIQRSGTTLAQFDLKE